MAFKCVAALVFVVLVQLSSVSGYKILMPFPSFSKSHLIIGSALLKGLAERGHEVTMISSFPLKTKVPNYRDIYIAITNELQETFNIAMYEKNLFLQMPSFMRSFSQYANSTMSHPEVVQMMKEESFDLVILPFAGGRFLSGLAAHFDCPLAFLTQIRAPGMFTKYVGNPQILATTPHIFAGYELPMSFKERVKNVIFFMLESLFDYFVGLYDEKFYNSNFPSPKYPSQDQVLRNTSLILSNYHFSQGIPNANLPNVIEIGGIQIETELSPLPKDMQEFLDNAEEGVIYFSFGSNLQSDKLPKAKVNAIITALTNAKQKVIMKWDTDDLKQKNPAKLFVSKWLPQNEILAHRNVKLFVSHGGMGSIAESKFYGVPVVGVPMFGDQMANVDAAVNEQWAVRLDFKDLTDTRLLQAINQVLDEPRYLTVVQGLSDLYKDRPQTAMETAVYWIEYVIRHKGARHMRSPAAQLNVFQRNSLDVFALILAVILGVLATVAVLISFVVRGVRWALSLKSTIKIKNS